MILINQILNLFDINLNQEFYAFSGMGTTHLCRISEKGLHEKVDNDWVLNNDILAELISGHLKLELKALKEVENNVRYRNKQST